MLKTNYYSSESSCSKRVRWDNVITLRDGSKGRSCGTLVHLKDKTAAVYKCFVLFVVLKLKMMQMPTVSSFKSNLEHFRVFFFFLALTFVSQRNSKLAASGEGCMKFNNDRGFYSWDKQLRRMCRVSQSFPVLIDWASFTSEKVAVLTPALVRNTIFEWESDEGGAWWIDGHCLKLYPPHSGDEAEFFSAEERQCGVKT